MAQTLFPKFKHHVLKLLIFPSTCLSNVVLESLVGCQAMSCLVQLSITSTNITTK